MEVSQDHPWRRHWRLSVPHRSGRKTQGKLEGPTRYEFFCISFVFVLFFLFCCYIHICVYYSFVARWRSPYLDVSFGIRDLTSGPAQRMAPFKMAVHILVLGYACHLPLKVVEGYWIFPGLVMLSLSWVVQLWQLFIQYHYCTLSGFPINWIPLFSIVSYCVSHGQGGYRTDPVGLWGDSYRPRHADWHIEM